MAKTIVINWRLSDDERTGLDQLAGEVGVKRSRLLRRLVREAVRGRPDYFADGVKEIRAAHRELAAVGRNLNQIAARLNEESIAHRFNQKGTGGSVSSAQLLKELEATRAEVKALKSVFASEIEAATSRGLKAVELAQ